VVGNYLTSPKFRPLALAGVHKCMKIKTDRRTYIFHITHTLQSLFKIPDHAPSYTDLPPAKQAMNGGGYQCQSRIQCPCQSATLHLYAGPKTVQVLVLPGGQWGQTKASDPISPG